MTKTQVQYTVIRIRGGGWYYDDPSWVRASCRYVNSRSSRYSGVGLRCALDLRAAINVTGLKTNKEGDKT